jgi:hypothetical protein
MRGHSLEAARSIRVISPVGIVCRPLRPADRITAG